MKRSVGVLVFCGVLLFALYAQAQTRVVVIPMGGKKGTVGKTGQTMCYDSACTTHPCPEVDCIGTGEDGEFQKGGAAKARFTDNEDGTVIDRLTGLVWLRDGNCISFFLGDATGQNARTWRQALAATQQLASGYCGLDDGSVAGNWRLPNIRELESLVDYSQCDPALPPGHPFLNALSAYYWSSTTDAYFTYGAWRVFFGSGSSSSYVKSNSYNVRAVRGGQ